MQVFNYAIEDTLRDLLHYISL